MRLLQAPASTSTDAGCNYEKAHALFAGEQQATWAMVDWLKPTGVSVDSTRAGHVFNASGFGGHTEGGTSLLLRPPGHSRHGVGNEHARSIETD